MEELIQSLKFPNCSLCFILKMKQACSSTSSGRDRRRQPTISSSDGSRAPLLKFSLHILASTLTSCVAFLVNAAACKRLPNRGHCIGPWEVCHQFPPSGTPQITSILPQEYFLSCRLLGKNGRKDEWVLKLLVSHFEFSSEKSGDQSPLLTDVLLFARSCHNILQKVYRGSCLSLHCLCSNQRPQTPSRSHMTFSSDSFQNARSFALFILILLNIYFVAYTRHLGTSDPRRTSLNVILNCTLKFASVVSDSACSVFSSIMSLNFIFSV